MRNSVSEGKEQYLQVPPMRESTSCQDTGRRTSRLPCLSWPSCLHQSDVNELMRTDSLGCVSIKQSVRVSSGFCCLSQLIVCNVTSTAVSSLRSCLVEALCFKLIPTDFPQCKTLNLWWDAQKLYNSSCSKWSIC